MFYFSLIKIYLTLIKTLFASCIVSEGLPNDCSGVKEKTPNATSGVYIIYLGGDKTHIQSIAVYCLMPASGDAWTVRTV